MKLTALGAVRDILATFDDPSSVAIAAIVDNPADALATIVAFADSNGARAPMQPSQLAVDSIRVDNCENSRVFVEWSMRATNARIEYFATIAARHTTVTWQLTWSYGDEVGRADYINNQVLIEEANVHDLLNEPDNTVTPPTGYGTLEDMYAGEEPF